MSGCQHNIAYIHLNYNAVFSTVYICICFINFGLFLFISASPEEKHFVNILFFFVLMFNGILEALLLSVSIKEIFSFYGTTSIFPKKKHVYRFLSQFYFKRYMRHAIKFISFLLLFIHYCIMVPSLYYLFSHILLFTERTFKLLKYSYAITGADLD